MEMERRVCQDCGAEFYLEESQIAWFVQRGMQPPRRCVECRRARRVANQQGQYDAIEHAKYQNQQLGAPAVSSNAFCETPAERACKQQALKDRVTELTRENARLRDRLPQVETRAELLWSAIILFWPNFRFCADSLR